MGGLLATVGTLVGIGFLVCCILDADDARGAMSLLVVRRTLAGGGMVSVDRVEPCVCVWSITPVVTPVPLLLVRVVSTTSSSPARVRDGSALRRPDLIPPWVRDSDLDGALMTFDPLPGGTRPEVDAFADSARDLDDGSEFEVTCSAV